MEQQNWARIRAIFEEAVELSPEDRASFMEASGIGPEERQIIESMLDADAAPPSMLDATQGSLSTLIADDEHLLLPEEIGPYSVTGLIGRGGMGLVVQARRKDLPKQVALKLIGDRWAGPELLERFRREQSVLARLQHPNIAQLLDAGRSNDGTPYFAMEFVDGKPITEYADQEHLDVRSRLDLFLKICEAVQFAHRNLVIHRDLKPSNILVSQEGRVKLLDFGISKLVDDDEQPLTITDFRALTPSYASPEQINGEAITTSSDVYGLGVVLYELLTGQRPYSLSGKSATAIAQILNEVAPPRPSEAVLSKVSSTSPTKSLSRILRGDLDNIILKALEKQPAQRYQSVEAFAADIRRYLDGLPVEARAATFGYRLRKFVALHRWGVGVAAGLVMLLVAFAASVTYQQAQTERQRARAELEAAKSERVVEFMLGLFEANDPAETLGDEITARQLLERGVERAESLTDQPVLQAQTYQVVGRVYHALGQYEYASDLLQKAADLQREHGGASNPDLVETLGLLSLALGGVRELDAATEAANEALRIAKATYAAPHKSIARALKQLAEVHRFAARSAEVDSLLELSYNMLVELNGPDDPQAVGTLLERATSLREFGRFEDAERLSREVLAWQAEHLPAQHPSRAAAADNLAVSLRHQSRYDEARPFYEEALAIRRAVLGENHPATAATLQNLAIFLGIQGHYQEAEPYFVAAIKSKEAAFGRVSARTAQAIGAYAVLLGRMGRNAEASALHRDVLAINEETLGIEHPQTTNSLYNLGLSLVIEGHADRGLPMLKRVVELERENMGTVHPAYTDHLGGLAITESEVGRHTEAEQRLREAVAIDLELRGPTNKAYGVRLGQLGRVLLGKGSYHEAESLLVQALQVHSNATDPDHPESLTILDALGLAKMHLGDFPAADSLIHLAYEKRLERLGPNHHETKKSARHLEELTAAKARR